MSGHSKWHTIKHKKGAADAKRGKIFTRIIKELTVAARNGGGDPGTNPRLRTIIAEAKSVNMPADNIKKAVQRGTGELPGVTYEEITYEAYGPGGTALIIECLTDNKNRTAPNIRLLFKKGQLGAGGSVSWDFNRRGAIEASPPAAGEDAEEAAIEAGAQEVEAADEGQQRFITEPTDLDTVSKALTARGWNVTAANLVWIPKNPVTLEGEARAEVEAFLAALDEDDDVQHLYVGLA